MPVKILNWHGGMGGDMILFLKSLSDAGSVGNVKYKRVSEVGTTEVDYSNMDYASLREVDKITLNHLLVQVNIAQLCKEVAQYDADQRSTWLKSHLKHVKQLDYVTVDMVADLATMPFYIMCNVTKTKTLDLVFCPLSRKIKDPKIIKNYAMYSIARDYFENFNTSSASQQLAIADLLINRQTFKCATDNIGLLLDSKYLTIYDQWLDANKQYMPSDRYQKKITCGDYDFMDYTLTNAERYTLMAFTGNRFINL